MDSTNVPANWMKNKMSIANVRTIEPFFFIGQISWNLQINTTDRLLQFCLNCVVFLRVCVRIVSGLICIVQLEITISETTLNRGGLTLPAGG